ncbi:MAG: hypothetical protein AB1830_12975 [Pseudomonadota bacterium]
MNEYITLLDCFAVHAPEPWTWFEPQMPPRPEPPPYEPIGNDGEAPDEETDMHLQAWRQDPCWNPEAHERYAPFSYWVQSWRSYWRQRDEWDKERVRQRDLQWPWFYAKTMLAQRKEVA